MGIKGLSATANRMYDRLTDAERREFFELIDSEATRLARVADQTASLLLLEQGELRYSFASAPLGDLIGQATEDHDRVRVISADGSAAVRCDSRRILEILDTLIDNAERYSPGPVQLDVHIDGPTASVVVIDDGPGLAPDLFDRAFERFASVRPSGYESEPGAGLGLFLARAHAAAHRGTLMMEAAEPSGTMLTLTLPLET